MTSKEQIFIDKFNDMLVAAKEMEKEGKYKTDFGTRLSGDRVYEFDREMVILELNRKFLENGYRLSR